MQTNLLIGSVGKDKQSAQTIQNDELSGMIKEKTSVEIKSFKIYESDRPYGMMAGIPGMPYLILSRGLYDSFTLDELQYVVLHEAGHYALAHTVKELGFGLGLLVAGVMILRWIKRSVAGILFALILGLVFGVISIQQGKYNELQADAYSLSHMDNPVGMITATEKFRSYYGKSLTQTNNKTLQRMFYRENPYDNRIKMAEDEIKRRQ